MKSLVQKNLKTASILSTIAAASVFLMACKQATAPLANSQQPPTAQASDETHSPVLGAQTTDQAVMNEGAQLNTLGQDSTATDKSFNDQSINVN